MSTLINVLVAVLVFWLIWKFLIPLLPAPLSSIVFVFLVVIAIVYLLRLIV